MHNYQSSRSRIIWVTNLPAPYRIPIWEELSKTFNLNVVFTLSDENWRGWKGPINSSYSYKFLAMKHIRIFDSEITSISGKIYQELKQSDLVIVAGYASPSYLHALAISKYLKIPIVMFYESTAASHRFNGFLVNFFRSRLFSLADYIVTSGEESTKAVLSFGVGAEKVKTLFNPVDVGYFQSISLEKRTSNPAGHRFIYVGQLIKRKNVASLINAFANIQKEFDSLTIIGDGELKDDLMQLAKDLNLNDSVTFLGDCTQDQVALSYASADTLVLPSTNEVWGLVVNEALAAGLHTVVSNKAGVSNFVKLMPGTYLTGTSVPELEESMKRSRKEWNGPILNPEILKFTPEKFTEELIQAINYLKRPDSDVFLWISNIATPYRISTWKALASIFNLHLVFSSQNEKGKDWDLSEQLMDLNIKVLNVKPRYWFPNSPIYLNPARAIQQIKTINPTTIYFDGYESPMMFISMIYAKIKRIDCIIGYRSTAASHRFNGFLVNFFRSRLFSLADYIVTSGEESTKAVLSFGVGAEKVKTLFNPVDVGYFQSISLEKRTSNPAGHRFIYVGQLIKRKNVASLINAFANIQKEFDSLTIIGDGELKDDLMQLAKDLNLNDSVTFLGDCTQDQVALSYASADTLVLPSTNEVWGLVVNEALAAGLHTVVSNKAGVSNFVKLMPGTYLTGTSVPELEESMKRSRKEWNGPILNPEILKFTPEKFTEELIQAINYKIVRNDDHSYD